MSRPAYSDRMAYVLAEMSSLAYYEFEGSGDRIRNAAKGFLQKTFDDEGDIRKWLETFADDLLIKGVDSEEFLCRVFENKGFKLLGASLFAPVKSHGMAIYRKKLHFIANARFKNP